ncbi:MAG: glycosyltransferase family 39 protein [Haloarculaceae archaeon]
MRGRLRAAKQQFVDDITTDPLLGYILGFALLLGLVGIWHRVPNFATRDERWRVIDPMEVIGHVVADPSIDAVKEGLLSWRNYGGTFYLYALAILPVVAVALLNGQMEVFVDAATHRFAAPAGRGTASYWYHWQQTPAWVWTWSIVLSRLVNVALGVASVYVMYRIGTTLRDRAAGRLMALFLTLSWVFQILIHEAGEDGPGTFFMLLAFYLALRYVESGESFHFLAGAAVGGFATAVKLSMGVSAIFLGVAYLLRARRSEERWTTALWKPKLFVGALGLGVITLVAGYPSAFAGGLDVLIDRLDRGVSAKQETHGWRSKPSWWWILRGYLHSVGIPMAVAFVGGVLATVPRIRKRSLESEGIILALVGLGVWLTVFFQWEYIRSTHLFPTVPILLVLVVLALRRLTDSHRTAGRALVAVLLVTSGLYTTVGVAGYVAEPRDQATNWLAANAPDDATVETYEYDPQEAAVPHGMTVNQPTNRTMVVDGERVEPGRSEWMRALPHRCPEYVSLTYPGALYYLAPENHSVRAQAMSNPELARYVRDLLAEETYPYRVAGAFGPRPWFLESQDPEPRGWWWNLGRVGVYPRTIQYGDPQDLGVNQYVVVLERTGRCDGSAD